MNHISRERRFIPEVNLRLVNKEASEVVGRPLKGSEKYRRFCKRSKSDDSPVMLHTKEDMVFLLDGPPYGDRALPTQLLRIGIGLQCGHLDALRHLALRLFDFARWSDPRGGPDYPKLWFKLGFSELLREVPRLETFRIVIDRLFSSAVTHRCPSPARSPSQLRSIVASMPRDKYGFSDYDAFAAATKCDIIFPSSCQPPFFSRPGECVLVRFEEYDPFFQKVLKLVRKYATTCPLPKNSTYLEVRLVVDLDSNLNGHSMGQVPHRKEKKVLWDKTGANGEDHEQEVEMVYGYDRYFARPATPDWYEDVSGYRLTNQGLDIEGGSSEAGDINRLPDQMMAQMDL
ncbi:hypothetical protein PG984_015376 [Apiospora sp. TS-2023a]